MCKNSMGRNRDSDNKAAQSGWGSDEQEAVSLVEDFISLDTVPPEIADEAEKLRDSGHPYQALNVLLESLE